MEHKTLEDINEDEAINFDSLINQQTDLVKDREKKLAEQERERMLVEERQTQLTQKNVTLMSCYI